ncbi:MAG TPA: hypothetical protein VHX86_11425 [Tepidisphaeraceae bacterium]|jgi:hypothetical protein|nr:hypothetical protein [Tepidisphaeraceae bacterium]
MSLRTKLNDSKVGVGVAVALLAVAAIVFGHYYFSLASRRPDVTRLYYSDDDGQSYFKDSVYKFPPFEHDGKTAVQAVLAVSKGHYFLGYLMRYTPQAREALQKKYDDAVKNGLPVQRIVLDYMAAVAGNEMEVKLPGSGHPWIPISRISTLDVRSPSGDLPDQYITQP